MPSQFVLGSFQEFFSAMRIYHDDDMPFQEYPVPLGQCFSTFLTLRPSNTDLHVVLTPTIILSTLLLQNCHFDTVINFNVNVCVF